MNFDRTDLFYTLSPGFLERESIRALPPEYVFEEQILDLHTFREDLEIPCPAHITFGLHRGDPASLQAAIRSVEEDWLQYFDDTHEVYCAYDGDQVVSFCLLDGFGTYQGLRVAGPGCVGTVPAYRKQGIGLKMVQKATALLKSQGYDLGYIHYTAVGHWYARLGYETLVKWNSQGLIDG